MQDAKMGFVSTYPYPEQIAEYSFFLLGAQSVIPGAGMDVIFTNSWYDPSMEEKAIRKLIGNGYDFIAHNTFSYDIPIICEEAGVLNDGWISIAEYLAPNTYYVSPAYDWSTYYCEVIDWVKYGETIPVEWEGNISNGGVYLAESLESTFSYDISELIYEMSQEICAGKNVFDPCYIELQDSLDRITNYASDIRPDAVEGVLILN